MLEKFPERRWPALSRWTEFFCGTAIGRDITLEKCICLRRFGGLLGLDFDFECRGLCMQQRLERVSERNPVDRTSFKPTNASKNASKQTKAVTAQGRKNGLSTKSRIFPIVLGHFWAG